MHVLLPPKNITAPVLPLYIAFGASAGLLQVTVPTLLQRQGLGVEATGMLALLYLPFGLSALWAPLVDRFSLPFLDRRKTWVLLCQIVVVAALISASFVGTQELPILIVALGFLSFASATMDVALDGFIAETSMPEDRLARGVLKVGGMLLGALFGSLFVLLMMERIGWMASVLVLSGLSTLATLPFLMIKRSSISTVTRVTPSFRRFFSSSKIIRKQMLIATVGVALGAGINATRLLLVERDLSLTFIGAIYGPVSLIAGLFGASAAALFGKRFGPLAVLFGAGAIFCIAMMLFDSVLTGAIPVVMAAAAFVALANAAYTAIYASICAVTMAWIDRLQAATDYSVAQSGWNLALVFGTALGGFGLSSLGLAAFPISGLAVVAALWMLLRYEKTGVVEAPLQMADQP